MMTLLELLYWTPTPPTRSVTKVLQDRCSRDADKALWITHKQNIDSWLYDVYYDIAHSRFVGKAKLAYNVNWCRSFAHGANMMQPIADLATRALKVWEFITHATWDFRSMVTHDIEIQVYEAGDKRKNLKDKPIWLGSFKTNTGRTIEYVIFEDTSKPIDTRMQNHPLNRDIYYWELNNYQAESEFQVDIDEEFLPILFWHMKNDIPFQISSMYEMITAIWARVFDESWIERNDTVVVSKIWNLPVNLDENMLGDRNPQVKYVLWKTIRRNGWNFLTMNIEFSFTSGTTTQLLLAYN